MNEFDLIKQFFTPLGRPSRDIALGIGDDAASLRIPANHELLISCDSLLEGVHFLADWDAFEIAYRALMVNLSDIAAMAGEARWFTLGLCLPEFDSAWLSRFSQGLDFAMQEYGVFLVGGNTSRGPLAIHISIMGLVEQGQALTRAGARAGDLIYLTGSLGEAALAVADIYLPQLPAALRPHFQQRLLRPKPRLEFAPILKTYASAAIDISDGLSADLGHILDASKQGALLQLEAIPLSPELTVAAGEQALEYALSGGDDYELCICIPATNRLPFEQALQDRGLKAYPIGQIQEQPGLRAVNNGQIQSLSPKGYQHFNA